MKKLLLFTDGSVHAQLKIGYGAYLLVAEEALPIETLKAKVKTKRFENTSSTKLELQTLLWAINEIPLTSQEIIIYTDAQNIIGLPARRKRLEENNYRTSKNKILRNKELYQSFYQLLDTFDIELVKVKGHLPSKEKDGIAQIFSLVDKASRRALRELL